MRVPRVVIGNFNMTPGCYQGTEGTCAHKEGPDTMLDYVLMSPFCSAMGERFDSRSWRCMASARRSRVHLL
eukprot:3854046-Pyramimonas_sp.AAC.1